MIIVDFSLCTKCNGTVVYSDLDGVWRHDDPKITDHDVVVDAGQTLSFDDGMW